jgi:hypothetical protein
MVKETLKRLIQHLYHFQQMFKIPLEICWDLQAKLLIWELVTIISKVQMEEQAASSLEAPKVEMS